MVLLQFRLEFSRLFVEEGSLDSGALFVYQVNVEQLAFTSCVFPSSDVTHFSDSGFDTPVLRVLIESLDWHVGISVADMIVAKSCEVVTGLVLTSGATFIFV